MKLLLLSIAFVVRFARGAYYTPISAGGGAYYNNPYNAYNGYYGPYYTATTAAPTTYFTPSSQARVAYDQSNGYVANIAAASTAASPYYYNPVTGIYNGGTYTYNGNGTAQPLYYNNYAAGQYQSPYDSMSDLYTPYNAAAPYYSGNTTPYYAANTTNAYTYTYPTTTAYAPASYAPVTTPYSTVYANTFTPYAYPATVPGNGLAVYPQRLNVPDQGWLNGRAKYRRQGPIWRQDLGVWVIRRATDSDRSYDEPLVQYVGNGYPAPVSNYPYYQQNNGYYYVQPTPYILRA